MGSPISLVLTDIYVEQFEQTPITTADLRPTVWLRYIDNTYSWNTSTVFVPASNSPWSKRKMVSSLSWMLRCPGDQMARFPATYIGKQLTRTDTFITDHSTTSGLRTRSTPRPSVELTTCATETTYQASSITYPQHYNGMDSRKAKSGLKHQRPPRPKGRRYPRST